MPSPAPPETRAPSPLNAGSDDPAVSQTSRSRFPLAWRPSPTVVAYAAAAACIAGGGTALLGYAVRSPTLVTLGLGGALHPFAAALFICVGLYVFAAARPAPPRRNLHRFGGALSALSVAALCAQLFGWEPPFTPAPASGAIGLTGMAAASTNIALTLAFGCTGLAIMLLQGSSRVRGWMVLPLLPLFWATYLSLSANFYRVERLNEYFKYTLLPLPAAALFVFALAGFLALQPRRGFMSAFNRRYLGGVLASVGFPLILLTPFTIGWLRVRALKTGTFDIAAAYSQFAVTNIVIVGAFIWFCAHMLNRIDARRLKTMASLQLANGELQRVNDEMTRVNAALEAKIEEQARTEEARQRTELQLFQSQKMEAMGTLASGIAHDFNNLLTVILLNAENVLETLPADSPQHASLLEIRRSGGLAADVIRQIMTFGRKSPAGLKPVCLEELAQAAAELVRHGLPRRVNMRIRFAANVPTILGDATQIQQVLLNLGTNAAQAMAEGGDTLEIIVELFRLGPGDALPHPDLSPGTFVRVTVRDEGCGMDEETLQKIFDPFFTTKPPGKGTGLGLSVVHGIMQLHRGCVTAWSEPQRGSSFSLYFPAADVV